VVKKAKLGNMGVNRARIELFSIPEKENVTSDIDIQKISLEEAEEMKFLKCKNCFSESN